MSRNVVPFFVVNLRSWGIGVDVHVHHGFGFVQVNIGPVSFGVEVWRE